MGREGNSGLISFIVTPACLVGYQGVSISGALHCITLHWDALRGRQPTIRLVEWSTFQPPVHHLHLYFFPAVRKRTDVAQTG